MEITDYSSGSKQICCSISLSDYVWIKKSQYSPSRLLRKAISDLQNNKSYDDLQEMVKRVERMGKLIEQQQQFVEDKGLTEQFGRYQDKANDDDLKRKKIEKELNKTPEEEVAEAVGDTLIKSKEDKEK